MTPRQPKPAGAEGEGHNPDSRVVGEREERLREALLVMLEAQRILLGGKAPADERVSLAEEQASRALASSPSPPDREDFALQIQSALDAIYEDAEIPLQWDELGERVAEHVFRGDES
jgi:hypothetical protein